MKPMRSVAPSQLLESGSAGRPRPLRMTPQPTSVLASALGLRLSGPDVDVSSFGPLSAPRQQDSAGAVLRYLSAATFRNDLNRHANLVVLTSPSLKHLVPATATVLLTQDDPRSIFYSLIAHAIEAGWFERLEGSVSSSARIAPSAKVGENVHVAEGAVIGPGVVLLPNTYVGPGVSVKPNAVIGGDGFERGVIGGRQRIVPHAGGVWLSEGVHVGSATSVDKGLFGEFTHVGPRTLIDNLVHFAHSASAGPDCAIIASAMIGGSVRLGEGVWVGPNSAINQRLNVGDHCYIGTGSVVTRDLPPHSLAYGVPAKVAAAVCVCRAKLTFDANRATCTICGKAYILREGSVWSQ